MEPKPKKKHSETWYSVLNPVRFAVIQVGEYYNGLEGIIIAEKKKDLMDFNTGKQRIVKISITEI